jgi:hypothetical protein
MAMNWLVPIVQETPLTFGAMRFPLNGLSAAEFLQKLSTVHPRCLMSFKAHLLLSDDSEEVCGGSELAIDWAGHQDITMEGTLVLSHCAEAFFDRISEATEILVHIDKLMMLDWDQTQFIWLKQMQQWLMNGYRIIVIREA